MGLLDVLRNMIPGRNIDSMVDRPRFRCLRCGSEFERQFETCPECGGRFVAEITDE